MEDTNRIREERKRKLRELLDAGENPYANDFQPQVSCAQILTEAAATPPPGMGDIGDDAAAVAIAGRVMARNNMGKAMFLRLRDGSLGAEDGAPENIQIYVRRDVIGEAPYALLKKYLDIGDILAVSGPVFQTRTGETTVMAHSARILTKSLRPLPEKFKGLTDPELRYRQRYVDLIMNPGVRRVFQQRALIISHIRQTLLARDFVEVETPMMHTIPGGATAKPFETFHNALSMPLYLRIAPELYLKRLLVGGFERVFELNRNFRNEGMSPKHNPEFTMLEFYQAYATYEDLITLTEQMLSGVARALNGDGSAVRPYGDHAIDWAPPFARMTVKESLVQVAGLDAAAVDDAASLRTALAAHGIETEPELSHGMMLMRGFDALVEHRLIQPTFITQFPIEASPLARRNEGDPGFADRFELFAAGAEIANAFSELNDPIDQARRFEAQVSARDAGDDEAMYMDRDYVRALEYGMPPAAGEGLGIDRVVMLMTDRHSIKEVIFFPHMRPE